RAIIERDPINLFWTFPSGQTGNPASLEQIVTASGEFSFGYISAAGCRSRDTSITVDIAQAFPIITAPDDSLACDRREILLDPGTIDPNATYSWVGPNNFSSNNPTPTINTIGTYAGVARYQNGCFTRDTSRIFLRTDETPFDLSEVINVTCEDTLSLVPQDRLKYSYNWRTDISPAIISNINDTVYTVNPGVYILEISQAGNLCYTIPVTIGDERDFPILSPNKNDISCDPNLVSQISLNPNNPDLINRVEWFGPNGFTSTAINISNLEEGTYRYLLTTVRGCNLRDTFEIIANTNAPRISFLQDSILLSCDDYNNTLGRNIQINSLDPVSNFSWVRDGDAAILSTNNSLIIIREG
ncbi:MAG TPA: hypothetical protein PKD85_18105, partial [Saprospiraceae bacterium]|nr:hypothetical protein [Saprospiraceae bacterium]